MEPARLSKQGKEWFPDIIDFRGLGIKEPCLIPRKGLASGGDVERAEGHVLRIPGAAFVEFGTWAAGQRAHASLMTATGTQG
jgi:hypothetical protein